MHYFARVLCATAGVLWCHLYYAGELATMSDPDYGFDRPMGDYADFVPRTPDPTLCEDTCANDSRCVAWSYVRPHSVKGANVDCYLKNTMPGKQEVVHAVSGIKIKP